MQSTQALQRARTVQRAQASPRPQAVQKTEGSGAFLERHTGVGAGGMQGLRRRYSRPQRRAAMGAWRIACLPLTILLLLSLAATWQPLTASQHHSEGAHVRDGDSVRGRGEVGGAVVSEGLEGESEALIPRRRLEAGEGGVGEGETAGTTTKSAPWSTLMSPAWKGGIPGSTLTSAAQAASFRRRLACLSAHGRWVKNSTPRLLPWTSDQRQYHHCDSRWVRSAPRKRISDEAADNVVHQGLPNKKWEVRPTLKFDWKVDKQCGPGTHLQEFDNARFRDALLDDASTRTGWAGVGVGTAGEGGGEGEGEGEGEREGGNAGPKTERVILVVGDSMQNAWARSILDNMRVGVDKSDVRPLIPATLPCFFKKLAHRSPCWGVHFFSDSHPGLKMIFIRNDFISIADKPWWTGDTKNYALPWIATLKALVAGGYTWAEGKNVVIPGRGAAPPETETRPVKAGKVLAPVVVLNKGLHYVVDEVFYPQLEAAMKAAREACPACVILFRNTPVGHKDCNQAHFPAARQNEVDLPYNWTDVLRQTRSERTKEIVESAGGVYLDVESMTAERPDGHTGKNWAGVEDCVHYCAPGPVDFWTKLLYHALMELLRAR